MIISICAVILLCLTSHSASSGLKMIPDSPDKKKVVEPYKIEKLTQGMGLYSLGAVSPDGKSMLLLAQKPEHAPNLYVMDLTDFSIRPPLTDLRWGVSDAAWSPDGSTIAFAGFGESASFSELYTLGVKGGRPSQMTRNNFSDKEPVFSPDGKRLYYTTDESPLPDAAFGILHIATMPTAGGKPEYFTEDEASTIKPVLTSDSKGLYLIKIDEDSGRHSLWEYGFDGKARQDLTERKFARIHRLIPVASSNSIVIEGQEEPEQEEDVYIFDLKTRQATELPNGDLIKRMPAVSPNGRRVVFISPTGTGTQLFLYDSTTSEIKQLTYLGSSTFTPVFISDERIVFGSNRSKDMANEIYLLDLAVPTPEEKKK